MRVLCSHALSSWKVKPEPTAAIPKGVTAAYNDMVTQMHSQTRLSSTAIDLISVNFFFAHPNLFNLICGSDMDMLPNNFCVFLQPNNSNFTRHTFLDLFFHLSF